MQQGKNEIAVAVAVAVAVVDITRAASHGTAWENGSTHSK
jgi:hypothetical protein